MRISHFNGNIFMSSGKASYRCDDCIKHSRVTTNDDTTNTTIKTAPKKALSPEREINLPPISDVGSISVQIETLLSLD
jgi:hypothetical protein